MAICSRSIHNVTARMIDANHISHFLFVTDSFEIPAIISADKYSRAFEAARHSNERYQDTAARDRAKFESQKTSYEKFMHWGKENRYPIIGVSWVTSMAIALGLVGRSPYLSTQQKLVQARVYAQGLTLAVLLATAVFEIGDRNEGEGRWETVKIVDPNDPEHKHLIDKKVHHESYAGEDMWKGGYISSSLACFGDNCGTSTLTTFWMQIWLIRRSGR